MCVGVDDGQTLGSGFIDLTPVNTLCVIYFTKLVFGTVGN